VLTTLIAFKNAIKLRGVCIYASMCICFPVNNSPNQLRNRADEAKFD